MKLYNAAAPNPRRVRIFLAEKGVTVPREDLDLQAGDSRTPEFLSLNSLGHTPVLELDDGTVLTESVAICRYLESQYPSPALMGRDECGAAQIEMWNRRIEFEIFLPLANVAQHTFAFFAGRIEQVPAFAEAQRRHAVEKWRWLDAEIADGRSFAAGDEFSIADITAMAALMLGDAIEVAIPMELEHVQRWSRALRARPTWSA